MPRGFSTPLIDGEEPLFAKKNVFSGNAGTPDGFFGVCKCCGLVRERNLGKHLAPGKSAEAPQKRHIENYKKTLKDQRSTAAIVKRAGLKVPETLAKKIHKGSIASSVTSIRAPSVTTAASVAAGARGGGGGGTSSSSSGGGTASSSASGGSLNTAEERHHASLQRPRARTAQQRRVAEVSDASGGEEVAAAEFKVPEPKTRGQKRSFEDAQEHHDQWWLRGGAQADDEPLETHTGDSPRAMSTRSNMSAWNAERVVQLEKLSWPEQDQLHSAGMGAIHRYIGASDLASVIGVSHVTAPSEEAEGMFRAGIGNPNALERIGALQIRMHLNE